MQVTCPGCSKSITIPDSKVPQGKSFSFACPQCKTKITAQGPPGPPVPEENPASVQEAADPPSSSQPAAAFDQDAYDEVVEEEEENKLRALVCDPNHSDQWVKALKDLDYAVTVAASVEDALRKLKFNEYHLVALNELYGTDNPSANLVKHVLDTMAMVTRRKMVVLLVGKDFKTFDNMMSFVKSADVVVNQADIANLHTVIRKARSEHELRYKVFREVLTAHGKP
jgi:hypothetical protein